jgi:hypothetical protein
MTPPPRTDPAAPDGATLFVNHAAYSRDHDYRWKTNEAIGRRAAKYPGKVMRTVIIHEGSCCRRDKCERSLAGLVRAAGDGDGRTLGITVAS